MVGERCLAQSYGHDRFGYTWRGIDSGLVGGFGE